MDVHNIKDGCLPYLPMLEDRRVAGTSQRASSEDMNMATLDTTATNNFDTSQSDLMSVSSAVIEQLQRWNCKWLRLSWHDYTGSSRCRLMPMKRIRAILEDGKPLSISIAKACLGLLPTDMMIPEVTGTGMYDALPDWSSLRLGPVPGHATVFLDFRDPAVSVATDTNQANASLCPRTLLRKTLITAASHGLEFLLGFELEFIILERNQDLDGENEDEHHKSKYRKMRNDGHAWSMNRTFADFGREGSFVSVIDELLLALDAADIEFEQFHSETAPGQYEIVLPPLDPLAACDALLLTRHIVEAVAARRGFRMTLHPKPFVNSPGSASHVHMSLSSPGGNRPEIYEPFYAGILRHYRSIIAFTYANPTSYERMMDSCWTGGRWVTWGTQNKEAPLRKCEGSHWEMKTLDGLANPYLAMAAILAAGTYGFLKKEPLVWADCSFDPAKLTAEQRKGLGISTMFPKDLNEALNLLKENGELTELLGAGFVQRYIDVKTAEVRLLEGMEERERREWVLERY